MDGGRHFMSPLSNRRDLKNPSQQFLFSHHLNVKILPPKAVDFDNASACCASMAERG